MEVLGGFASAIFLLVVLGLMVYGSVERLITPEPIHCEGAMLIAVLGLVVNLVLARILGAAHHQDTGMIITVTRMRRVTATTLSQPTFMSSHLRRPRSGSRVDLSFAEKTVDGSYGSGVTRLEEEEQSFALTAAMLGLQGQRIHRDTATV